MSQQDDIPSIDETVFSVFTERDTDVLSYFENSERLEATMVIMTKVFEWLAAVSQFKNAKGAELAQLSNLFALELANVTCGLLGREVIRLHETLPRSIGFEDNRNKLLVVHLFLKAMPEAIKVSIEDTARRVKNSYRRLANEDIRKLQAHFQEREHWGAWTSRKNQSEREQVLIEVSARDQRSKMDQADTNSTALMSSSIVATSGLGSFESEDIFVSIDVLPKQNTIRSILTEAVTAGATGSLSVMCLRLVQTNAMLSLHRATSLPPREGFDNGCSTWITGFSLIVRWRVAMRRSTTCLWWN
ncbi:hypothetical protein HD553DRAFT_325767 [Filobasidium floriforme]|uniref:uncharacterized protein n=1 Tax=Filobasidium floriforme TaxID=5210 RepID=UPI001E8CFA97|nr:uncharacterized protein HD553DRAFT_325767 [Filobasidium floriforme]KAH8080786.1 hypothetical protein HD553DRAFT_325767 [Filobasidium floriforme]